MSKRIARRAFVTMVAVALTTAGLGSALWAGKPAPPGNAALWQEIRSGGHVILIRHALAPGVGDPVKFDLQICETQRNLNDQGRVQGRRIGDLFNKNGVPAARVYSSQWCRCLETARLLNLGPVAPMSDLNSFFRQHERREAQTQALRDWIARADLGQDKAPVVLVTHQVNITALTGRSVASGEIVVLKRTPDGGVTVRGSIRTD